MKPDGFPPPARRRRRSRLNWKRVLLVFAVIPGAAVLIVILALNVSLKRAEKPAEPPAPDEPVVMTEAPPAVKVEKVVISRGDSLARLLKPLGFDSREIYRLKEAAKPVYDLAKIISGHELRLFLPQEGGWQSLEYDIDETRYVTVSNGPERITAEIKYYPFEVKPALVYGAVDTSLIAAMNKLGEDDSLALDLVERCFGWDIDYYSDLRRGDTFKIFVEKKFLDGRFAGYRNILAAEFVNDGKAFHAFRFTYPDTEASDYFDETGFSKRKEFLKSPFKFTPRITSRFSASRFHPILKIYRPHYGVDYAAPIGTPVQATADGTVTLAGWSGGSGRMVRLQHKNHFETMYLHLSGFGPGIKKGAEVRSGQVLGYVGSSGESTGPHLDYRIYDHGRPVNPLAQKFRPADPVRKEFLDAYTREVRRLEAILDAPEGLRTALLGLRIY
jgi:murein DD-endopeptidase MepM/ murein hydrolase activator NlpD